MSRKHSSSKHSSPSRTLRRNKSSKRNLLWLWLSLGALAVVVVGMLVVKPWNKPASASVPGQTTIVVVKISPAQAYAKYQQGAYLLDVRTQEEWDQAHITGSTLIPLDQLQGRITEVPTDEDIVVICQTGHRAQNGAAILLAAGYQQVSCLDGGLNAWEAAGYPVEGNP